MSVQAESLEIEMELPGSTLDVPRVAIGTWAIGGLGGGRRR
jgi:hypothetical protein